MMNNVSFPLTPDLEQLIATDRNPCNLSPPSRLKKFIGEIGKSLSMRGQISNLPGMRAFHFILSITFGLNIFSALAGDTRTEPLLLTRAHAHNDYAHAHPLRDALDQGFCSVEADIFLKEGKLLVAHEAGKTSPQKTLQSLYLDPLRSRVQKNHGHVFPNGPEFTLLVDLKEDWRTIYPALHSVLTNYADILTTFQGDVKHTNAILVIISGNRDLKMFAEESTRYAAYDGDLSNLEQNQPATLVPWISINWQTQFSWNGQGAMSEMEAAKLRAFVTRAHAGHSRLRFWGAPDNLTAWKVLSAASVDLINTDDLAGVQNFFKANALSH
jgi:hypothetical protein